MNLSSWALHPAFHLLSQPVSISEFVGNVCSLATVGLAMRRSVWSWPVQLLGSICLATVFLSAGLGGNAGRQIIFGVMATYGWVRWHRGIREEHQINPTLAGRRERLAGLALLAAGTVVAALLLQALHASWGPWPDGFVLVGSILATWGQARARAEFWIVWLAVDTVGLPLAIGSGLWFTGMVYGVFFLMALSGLISWWHRANRQRGHREDSGVPAAGTVTSGRAS